MHIFKLVWQSQAACIKICKEGHLIIHFFLCFHAWPVRILPECEKIPNYPRGFISSHASSTAGPVLLYSAPRGGS